jgi:predicted nucleic acid-binding protein
MPAVVVDTCVLSGLFRGGSLATSYRQHVVGRSLVISFMTLAELYRWPLERNWGERRRRELEAFVNRRSVVYPFNRALCRQWAITSHQASRNGHPIQAADAWIAATAMLHGIPLVTHNRRHFEVLQPDLTLITES